MLKDSKAFFLDTVFLMPITVTTDNYWTRITLVIDVVFDGRKDWGYL